MSDTLVRCRDCGAEQRLDFADGLRDGWPKCYCRDAKYGLTMHLERTGADIGAATGAAIHSQIGDARG